MITTNLKSVITILTYSFNLIYLILFDVLYIDIIPLLTDNVFWYLDYFIVGVGYTRFYDPNNYGAYRF